MERDDNDFGLERKVDKTNKICGDIHKDLKDLAKNTLTFEDVTKATRSGNTDYLKTISHSVSGISKIVSQYQNTLERRNRTFGIYIFSSFCAAFILASLCILAALYAPGIIERQGLSEADKYAITLFQRNNPEIQTCFDKLMAKGRTAPEPCTINIY